METTPYPETIGGDGPAAEPEGRRSAARPGNGSPGDASGEVASALWSGVGILLRWKWFIVGVTTVVAVLTIVLALRMDNWYGATARVLPPEGGGGGSLGGLIGDLSPIASSMLGGGGGGDYTRYLAILTSRNMLDTIVERFDLVEVYDVGDEPDPQGAARAALYAGNLAFEIDLEFEFLAISAFDTDPQRAAQIANFAVEELNRRNQSLAVEGASRYRTYVEERYREIETDMDSARAEMQAFQERNGVVELPSTAQAFMASIASARAEVAQAEIQYQGIAALAGPDNPQVIAAREALAAARAEQRSLEGGGESFMPVPLQRLPAVANEYASLTQELMIQQALMENARPLYEQARFDEERDRVAVQVLDEAVPPKRKARPRRSIMVIIATISAGLLASLFALAASWLKQNRAFLAARLRSVS